MFLSHRPCGDVLDWLIIKITSQISRQARNSVLISNFYGTMFPRLKNLFGLSEKSSALNLDTFSPMKLIIWLGNPWSKYTTTRHNLWFLALDEIVQHFDGTDLLYTKKYDAELSSWVIWKRQVLFVKPQTFMNKSWSCVSKLANFYKVSNNDILVIHDDIDHTPGKIKLKFSGSHGGHNWIRDITERLGSQQFRRLKLWIWRPVNKSLVTDYVLWQLKEHELTYRNEHREDIFEQVQKWLKNTG